MAENTPETKPKPAKRRQGPRRSEASRAAILEATRDELVKSGWRKFSVDSVARRARASKQTIYRWWPATGSMCIEAAIALLEPADPAQTGPHPSERLAALLCPLETSTRSGNGHAVMRGALMAAADDKEAGNAWRSWMKTNVRAPLRLILAELASKQMVRRDYDIDEAVNLLISPVWHNLLIMHAPLKSGFADEQAARLLKVMAP
jgi:AcrR family transcriptional regulator